MKIILLSLFFISIMLTTSAQVLKTVNVTAGGLSSVLTAQEKSSVTNLTVTGTIDARDFKTLRDAMPSLSFLDISGVKVATYTGTEGTSGVRSTTYPAATIPAAAFYNSTAVHKLMEIKLPKSITAIGHHAFKGCTLLEAVVDQSELTTIGDNSFEGCTKLYYLNLPITTKTIGNYAFNDCWNLSQFEIPSSVSAIGEGAFKNCKTLSIGVLPQSLFKIEDFTFFGCLSIISLSIPSTVGSLGNSAFAYCENITGEVVIPPWTTIIGRSAFFHCSNITSVIIKSPIQAISDSLFSNCTRLNKIEIPDSYKTVGKSSFSNCVSLNGTFLLPEEVTSIGDSAFFSCFYLDNISIPASVNHIGRFSFASSGARLSINNNNAYYSMVDGKLFDKGITKIIHCPSYFTGVYSLPETVTHIGEGAFYYSRISSVIIPPSVVEIEPFAFQFSNLINELFIPSGVTTIGEGAFRYCTGLRLVVLPASITHIGNYAFDMAINLKKVYFLNSTPPDLSLAIRVFPDGLGIGSILYVPEEAYLIFANKYPWNNFLIQTIPRFLSLSKNSVTVGDSLGSSESIIVLSTGTWVANSNQPWLKISPPTAKTGFDRIILQPDINYGAAREAQVMVMSSQGNDTLFVTQQQSTKTYLSTKEISLNALANSNAVVEVISMGSWVASSDQPWLTIEPNTHITGNGTLTVTATQNIGDERMANITVISSLGTVDTIKVTQQSGIVSAKIVEGDEVKLYPNPVTEGFTIYGLIAPARVRLFDTSGRLWVSETFDEGTTYISTKKLPKGVYIANITTSHDECKKMILKE